MASKGYREARARIKRVALAWHELMGLNGWRVAHRFFEDSEARDAEKKHPVVARTSGEWDYKHLFIDWYLNIVEDIDDRELEETYIHEVLHTFIDGADVSEERVATELAQVILNVRDNTERRTRKSKTS